MKMEVLPVQNQFQGQFGVMGSSKIKDWTRPLTPPATNRHLKSTTPKTGSNVSATTAIINKSKTVSESTVADTNRANKLETTENLAPNYANDIATINTDTADETAVQSLSLRLQNELRRAKSQHLACTEVLLPSDLLNRIASKMIAMSEKEPCGIRGSIIYIEFEDEPNNTRPKYSLNFRIVSYLEAGSKWLDINIATVFKKFGTKQHNYD